MSAEAPLEQPHEPGLARAFRPGARVRLSHGKPWGRSVTMTGTVERWADGILTLRRQFAPGGLYDSLDEPKHLGDYGTIDVVAGGWVLRRRYFRADGTLIGELYNIQTPTQLEPGLVRYTDLEVDVVHKGAQVLIVDEADLEAAVRKGGISPELADIACEIAHRLVDLLRNGGDWRAADAPFRRSPPRRPPPRREWHVGRVRGDGRAHRRRPAGRERLPTPPVE